MLLHQIKVECVMACVVLVGLEMRWSAEGHAWGHCGTVVNKKDCDIMASRFVPWPVDKMEWERYEQEDHTHQDRGVPLISLGWVKTTERERERCGRRRTDNETSALWL